MITNNQPTLNVRVLNELNTYIHTYIHADIYTYICTYMQTYMGTFIILLSFYIYNSKYV
jgi:hypothetical protein